MKVGGNESATKYFRANGGSAALASKDPKTKYQSAAATKYKEELKKRAARDALEFPDEVVIADAADADGSSTPASEPNDDFFSSWDKPSIKRPTPPISRTATPPVVGRTPSPFLNANANGKDISRSASPLSKPETSDAKPAASRITTSAALRKTTTGGAGPRKTNVLGAKKTTKLGAKKVTGDIIDFDEAEKKAKEEAERIAKLGYDPEAEEAATKKAAAASKAEASNIAAPTPASPPTYGSGHSRQKSAAEVERLGMGFGRLGFGQVGGPKAAAAPAAKKNAGGFGSVGPVKAAAEGRINPSFPACKLDANKCTDESERYARNKFGTQKGISSDEFFGKGSFDPNAQAEAKTRLQGFEGASAISSNAYFGRPEDEEQVDDYGDLETAAKDFVRKFGITAGDDLENLTSALGEGATRLQGAIRNYLGS